MSEELKPCPFCDHDAYVQGHNEEGTHPKFFVCCGNCYCSVGEAYDSYGEPAHCFSEQDVAIAAWNTRSESPLAASHARLVEALELYRATAAHEMQYGPQWEHVDSIARAALADAKKVQP